MLNKTYINDAIIPIANYEGRKRGYDIDLYRIEVGKENGCWVIDYLLKNKIEVNGRLVLAGSFTIWIDMKTKKVVKFSGYQ